MFQTSEYFWIYISEVRWQYVNLIRIYNTWSITIKRTYCHARRKPIKGWISWNFFLIALHWVVKEPNQKIFWKQRKLESLFWYEMNYWRRNEYLPLLKSEGSDCDKCVFPFSKLLKIPLLQKRLIFLPGALISETFWH